LSIDPDSHQMNYSLCENKSINLCQKILSKIMNYLSCILKVK